MSYNTKYTLTYDGNNLSYEQMEEINDYLLNEYGIQEFETDWIPWHEHTEDMIDLSLKYPDVEFTLWGRGEDRDDLWKKYFLNGVCFLALAEITYKKPDWSE